MGAPVPDVGGQSASVPASVPDTGVASVPPSVPDTRAVREAFYRRISGSNLTPLWEVLHDLVPSEPRPRCQPALWKYSEVRPLVMESGRVISAKEATRRVLIL